MLQTQIATQPTASPTPSPMPAPPTPAPQGLGVMRFGNDIVVPSQGDSITKTYSVLTSDQAKQDFLNKQNFLDMESQKVVQQSMNNQQMQQAAESEQEVLKAETATADALNKAADAVSGIPQPTNSVSGQYQQLQMDLDSKYKETQNTIGKIQSGVIPLTSDQQAQYDSLKQQFQLLRDQQLQHNKAYEGGITTTTVRSGTSRYAQEFAANKIKQAVDAGVSALADLDSKAASALSKMKSGFISDNIKVIQSSYDEYAKAIENKTKAIKDMHDMVQDEMKAQADAFKSEQDILVKQRDYNTKNNVNQPFYMQGGYLFNSYDGSLVGSAEEARQLGVADDLSNVTIVDNTDHSPMYKEWQDYSRTGGELGFNEYMTMDANRKATRVTNTYNIGGVDDQGSKKQMTEVQAIIDANPREWGKAADAIDRKFGQGTSGYYDGLLKQTYLLPSRAQQLADDPKISTFTVNQVKDLRNKFIQDNGYVDPQEAAKVFDEIVGKGIKSDSGRSIDE